MILSNFQRGVFALGIILFAAGAGFSQTVDLQTILQSANLQTQKYGDEFKNLLANETKIFRIFDRDGEIKKETVIESNFIVYQSEKQDGATAEYRNVLKVDGKAVGDVEKRNANLFEQIAKAKSVVEELEKIQKESARYDKNLEIAGFTLLQAPVLDDSLRPFFEFSTTMRESFEDGNEYYAVEYVQIKQSPNILINRKISNPNGLVLSFDVDLPEGFKDSDVFLQGYLSVNTKTFQIGHEVRKVVAKKGSEQVVLQETEFFYQPSEFGILVPKSINFIQNKVKRESGKLVVRKNLGVSFVYSNFRRANVEVKILDENEN